MSNFVGSQSSEEEHIAADRRAVLPIAGSAASGAWDAGTMACFCREGAGGESACR